MTQVLPRSWNAFVVASYTACLISSTAAGFSSEEVSPGKSRVAGRGPDPRSPTVVLLVLSWIVTLVGSVTGSGWDTGATTESFPPAAAP